MNQKQLKWLRFVKNFFTGKYRYKAVDDIPAKPKKRRIYIVQEGTEPETIVLVCPCGCKNIIHLNLLDDTSPSWTFKQINKNISIFPSIAAKGGCKSHFWITESWVVWNKMPSRNKLK